MREPGTLLRAVDAELLEKTMEPPGQPLLQRRVRLPRVLDGSGLLAVLATANIGSL